MQVNNFINKDLKHVFCPTCGEKARTKIHSYLHIGFYQCNECDIEYASPRMSEDDLINLYQGDDYRDYESYKDWNYQEWKQKREKPFFLINETLNLITRFLAKGDSILDVGSDIGLTIRHLNENGYKSIGIEVSEVASKIANNLIKAPTFNSEIHNFHNQSDYDGLLLRAVLEHLHDPVKVLTNCASKLKSGGLIFIDVPHHKGLSWRYKKFLHKIGVKKNYKHFGFPAHLYAFDKKSLTLMLRKSGFETIFFESWPKALTTGRINPLNKIFIKILRKYCLTDYINVVARKV